MIYCIVLSILLFSKGEWTWWSSLRNWQAIGYHVLSPSVDTGYMLSIISYDSWQKPLGNKHVSFLSYSFGKKVLEFDDFLAQLIAIQSHINSGPTLSNVSSTMNSSIFLLFFEDVLLKWPFWIHFQIATWLLLTLCKNNNALATHLVDKPRKYKYNAWSIFNEDVLCFFWQPCGNMASSSYRFFVKLTEPFELLLFSRVNVIPV